MAIVLFPANMHIIEALVKESACQCRRNKAQVQSLGWEGPLE